jgi:hypothetical protein
MVKKALINGLDSGKIIGDELYNLDDTGLFTLLKEKTGDSLVESVSEKRIFALAAEIPHDQADILTLQNIKNRLQLEEKLTMELSRAGFKINKDELIIDVPEPVSFETGLFVVDEKCSFSDSSSAFKTETVNAFIKTLYTIRIFINQKNNDKIKTFPPFYGILNKLIRSEV